MGRLEKLNNELNRLFDLFNDHFYNGAISKPVIAVQTNGRERLTMGWCTCNKVWKDHSKNEYYYEITICSEYLYRGITEICSTLLHEMVHLYCLEKEIKDTSRGHTYHNKRFKSVAEEHGLIVSYDSRIGWSISKLSLEAEAFVLDNADTAAFMVTRHRHSAPRPPKMPIEGGNETGEEMDGGESEEGAEEPEKPKQSLRKYVCPKCRCIIRASKDVNVICGECKVPFEKDC